MVKLIADQKDSKYELDNSIISDFCFKQINRDKEEIQNYGDKLYDDLKTLGLIKKRNEMINCLYGINPLYRCFYRTNKTIYTAVLLIEHTLASPW